MVKRVTYLELREILFGRDKVDIRLDKMCERCPVASCDESSLWCQYRMAIGRPNDVQKERRKLETRKLRAATAL